MPSIDTIETNYNRKIQLEQFEPVQVGVTLTVELEDGDDPDAVFDEYEDRAEDMVERALAARITQHKIDADSDD